MIVRFVSSQEHNQLTIDESGTHNPVNHCDTLDLMRLLRDGYVEWTIFSGIGRWWLESVVRLNKSWDTCKSIWFNFKCISPRNSILLFSTYLTSEEQWQLHPHEVAVFISSFFPSRLNMCHTCRSSWCRCSLLSKLNILHYPLLISYVNQQWVRNIPLISLSGWLNKLTSTWLAAAAASQLSVQSLSAVTSHRSLEITSHSGDKFFFFTISNGEDVFSKLCLSSPRAFLLEWRGEKRKERLHSCSESTINHSEGIIVKQFEYLHLRWDETVTKWSRGHFYSFQFFS